MGGYSHLRSILVRQEKRVELGLDIDDYVIISVGELNDNKNHQVIIHTIANIDNKNVKYVIVGKGILEDQLRPLIKELDIEERVLLTGFRNDVRDLLWSADCFAFPSIREGLGIAALEGLTAGLPIIGHDVGGIKDYVIDGVTGWRCKTDYSLGIIKTMDHRWKRKKMSEIAKRFDVKTTELIMKKVYDNLKTGM